MHYNAHTQHFAHLDLTRHTPLDSHELGFLLRAPLGFHEPFFVVRTAPCFDNRHTGSKHKHAALTERTMSPFSVWFGTCINKVRNMVQQCELGRVAFAGYFICFTD